MKKIMFKNLSITGGAPKSLLEYAKLAKKKYGIISVGEIVNDNKILKEYKKNKIKVLDLQAFGIGRGYRNLINLFKYTFYIKQYRPDLIVSITTINFFFDNIIHRLTNIPIIYIVPGGKVSEFITNSISDLIFDGEFIVFSKELLNQLNPTTKNKTHLITNRISIPSNMKSSETGLYHQKNRTVLSVIIGRLDQGKINSVRYVLKLTEKLNKNGYPFFTTVVGDGAYSEEIKQEVYRINKRFRKDIINFVGYQDNVEKYIEEAHIVFGKGRSVLDGVFHNKFSIVVNETEESFIIDKNSFTVLLENNFTGRNNKDLQNYSLNIVKYEKLSSDILNGTIKTNYLNDTKKIAEKHYDISIVSEQILEMYNQNIKKTGNNKYKINYLKLIVEYLKTYKVLIYNRIKSSFKK